MCVCSSSFVLAHAILDSLALLASLRPRSSAEDAPSLVPPPAILHKLHRSLATEATPGWHGTLPPARSTALRDDATVKVRPGAVTAPTAATSAAGGSQPAAPSAANTFGAYGYSYGRAQPAAAYTPYKPGQAPAYYQSYGFYGQQAYGTAAAAAVAAAAAAGAATGQTPYGSGAATAQQAYTPYGGYYSQYQPAGSYSTFFSQTQQQQTGSTSGSATPVAVANTAVGGRVTATTTTAQQQQR